MPLSYATKNLTLLGASGGLTVLQHFPCCFQFFYLIDGRVVNARTSCAGGRLRK